MAKVFFLMLFFLLSFIGETLYGQVNLQNGSPQIDLPLYSISDANNRLSTSVSLSYVGGNGLKVDDPGSSCGTGWDLNFGGYISREQIGEADDQYQNGIYPDYYWYCTNPLNLSPEQIEYGMYQYVGNYYPNGYINSTYNANDVITNGASYSLLVRGGGATLGPPQYLADRELDVFTFNFNGRTGQFLIGKDKSVFFLNEKDSKLKLIPTFDNSLINQGIRTTLSKFTIIDETGIEYIFQDMELDEVAQYIQPVNYSADGTYISTENILTYPLNYESSYNFMLITTPNGTAPNQRILKGYPTHQFVCNKWMLTSIVNPLTNKTISFNYNQEEITTEGEHSAVRSAGATYAQTGVNVTVGFIDTKIKQIASITNEYGDKILFNYGMARQDLSGDNALTSVSFYKNNNYTSEIDFTYGYFYQQTIQPAPTSFTSPQQQPFLRLCLKQMQKLNLAASISEPPSQFTYYSYSDATDVGNANSPDFVPARYSFYHDWWGYYNLINDNPQFDPVASTNNVYPYSAYYAATTPGGRDYGNSRDYLSGLAAENGLIKSITYPTGGTLSYTYEPNMVSYKGTNTYVGGIRVNSTALNDVSTNTVTETDYTYLLSDDNTSSGWGYNPPIFSTQMGVSVENCNNGQAGAGITPISSSMGIMLQISVQGLAESFGVPPVVSKIIANVIIDVVEMLFPPPPPPPYFYSTLTNTSSYALNYNNPLPLNYSQVEIKTVNNNTMNGKTIYYFTSPTDYPIEFPDSVPHFSYQQRYGYWKYGLIKRIEYYNNANFLLKAVQNNYTLNPSDDYNNSFYYLSQHWIPQQQNYVCTLCEFTGTDALQNTTNVFSTSYYPFSGKVDLLSTDVYTYDPTDNTNKLYVLTSSSYVYNTNYLLSQKIEFDSKGQEYQTLYYYSGDYSNSASAAIATMQSNNDIASPVLTETYVIKPTETDLVKGSIVSYSQIANGDIKPSTIYIFRTPNTIMNNALINNTALVPFNPSQIVRDPNYYQPVTNLYYDTYGSLIQKTTESSNTGYIFDQPVSDRLIGTVTNAQASAGNTIAYSSFEDNCTGNWIYTGTLTPDPTSPTGGNCFYISHSNPGPNNLYISAMNLLPTITYVVSYWSKDGSYTVTGSTSVTTGRTANGWTYYQHTVTGVTVVQISGTGYIDELRLYPQNTFMETITYCAPFAEVSSQCDDNNRIVYNSYDGLGRLNVIRDQDQNILKAYDYEYQVAIPRFYNIQMSANFVKGNCSPGYGTIVTYTVPAGRYSSSISSEDANQQAQNDINSNGQNYANASSSSNNCSTLQQYKVYMTNTSGYSNSNISVTIDGTNNIGFPPTGSTGILTTTLSAGPHTMIFSCGSSGTYGIAPGFGPGCGNSVPYTIGSNITLSFIALPPTYTAIIGNLTSDQSNATACSCTECQYTKTVYISPSAILGTGVQLYLDQGLTQPVTNMTWFEPYSPGNVAWPLNSNGVISGGAANCP